MKSNVKKSIGRIALGIMFLLDPNIAVVDVLPDFVGCLLIISGLSSLRDLSDSLEDARMNFMRLFWVSLSHIPAFMLMIYISASFVNEKTSILVFSFVYGVVEFFLINNAISSLIDGFVYIGERYNGDACFYDTDKKGRRTDVSRIRLITTVILLIVKGLSIAPNLVYLYDTSLGYGTVLNSTMYNPVSFIGPITAICFVPALLLGLFWARRIRRYICGIRRDADFVSRIDGIIDSKAAENTPVYRYRRTTTAVYILSSAAILSVDLYIDEFNIIPDLFCALVMFFGALFFSRRFAVGKLPIAICGIYAAAEAGLLAYASYFNIHFKFADVGRVVEADGAFTFYFALMTVCEIMFAASVFFLMRAYSRVLSEGFASAVRKGHTKAGKDVFYESHKKRSITVTLLAAATGVCHVLQLLSMGDMRRILLSKNTYTDSSGIYAPSLEGFWMVNLLVSVVFISFTLYTFSKSREELKERLYIL